MLYPNVVTSFPHQPSRSRFLPKVVLIALGCSLGAGYAAADSRGLEAYNAYVAGLEDLGFTIRNGKVDYDETSDTLVLTDSELGFAGEIEDVVLEGAPEPDEGGIVDQNGSEATDLSYSFSLFSDTVSIKGLSEKAGAFSLDSWVYSDNSKFEFNGSAEGKGRVVFDGRISGASTTNYSFTIPKYPAPDPDRQASRWLPFMKSLLLTSYDEIRVDATAMTFEAYSQENGLDRLLVSGTAQLDGYRMSDAVNGKVGNYSMDSMVQSLRVRDEYSGDMVTQTTRQGKTEYQNMDLAALVDLFDPAVPETGDERTLIGYGTALGYQTTQEVAPGVALTFKVDRSTLRDISLTKRDFDVLDLLDRLAAKSTIAPEEVFTGLFQLYRSFGIADARASGVSVDVPVPDLDQSVEVTIKEMAMVDVNSDGIGELMIVGVDAPNLPEGGYLKLDWAAIGDIEFADYLPIQETIGKLVTDPDYGENNPMEIARAFLPRSFAYEIEGLDVSIPEAGRTRIDKSEFSISTDVPPFPTSLYAKNDGVRVAVDVIEESDAREFFKALGLEELDWSDETRLYWDEATKELHLERLAVEIKGLGLAEASANFANVPRAFFEDPEGQGQIALVMAQFVGAEIRFVDEGLANKGVAYLADTQSIPVNVFREALAAQAAETADALGNAAFTDMVRDAASDFLENPGTLTLSLSPDAPVPLAQIMGSLAAPQTLPDLLKVEVWAE